ncbi:MAG: DUF1573 domain-containing protein [Planctomycetota bacterium]
MKLFVGCCVFIAVGGFSGYQISKNRYAKYPAFFGPFDEAQSLSIDEARKLVRQDATDGGMVELPQGKSHDFGVMAPEEKGEYTFVIRNVGQDDLSLRLGASTCKCTLGELGSNKLAPGEQTDVKMSWTVKTTGKTFGQSAEVITNDPKNLAVKFEIGGQVIRDMEAVPDAVAFGEVAAGEPIRFDVRVYNYTESSIDPETVRFSNELMNELSSVDVTEFEPSDADGIHASANQGFLVASEIGAGLKQGPISQNLIFRFTGNPDSNAEAGSTATDRVGQITVPITGRIVGALSMLETTKLKGVAGGGYLYDFGSVEGGADAKMSAFVRLKGSQQADTTLSIGEISPSDVVVAKLGPPVGAGPTKLHSLKVELQPGSENVERLGLNREDYGFVIIESDNPKVPALKLRLKFSLPAR